MKAFFKSKRIYMIGIGGISMSSLALLSIDAGAYVCGSDAVESEQTQMLRERGVDVFIDCNEHYLQNNHFDVVVYSDSISDSDEELVFAKQAKIKCVSRGAFLSEIIKEFPLSIGVAGSHGKTTCTAMIASVFKYVDIPFTCHIGGLDYEMQNYYSSGDEIFLTEVCEYKKNINKVNTSISVVLNIDMDHMECYKSYDELKDAFISFAERSEYAISLNGTGRGVSFGIDDNSYYCARQLKQTKEKYSFMVYEDDRLLGCLKLSVIGIHNIYNALACIGVCRRVGIDFFYIKKALEKFKGVKRRFENIGSYHGATFICDYAHHPVEISAVLRCVQKMNSKVYVVFQPHTYSRTKLLFDDFVRCLERVEDIVIYKTYAAREKFDVDGSAYALSCALSNSIYLESVRQLKYYFRSRLKSKDIVLFLGAGDIYYVAKQLLNEFKSMV